MEQKRNILARYLLDIIEVCTDRLHDINNLPEEQTHITVADIERVYQIWSTLNNISVEIPL